MSAAKSRRQNPMLLGERADIPRVVLLASSSLFDLSQLKLHVSDCLVRRVEPTDDLQNVAQWQPDLVLVDNDFPVACAIDSIRQLRKKGHPVIGVLAEPSGAAVEMALTVGADTICEPPFDAIGLRRLLAWKPVVGGDVELLMSGLPTRVVDASPTMVEVWRLVFRAAQTDVSVVIHGETGTGKEIIAKLLHRFSPRRLEPFVAINCAALPDTLLESELFGYEKGAFTGAAARRKGRFELANRGTLLLDEIGDMPLALQVKLLRVLQEKTVERLGCQAPHAVDVRVLAASHRDLVDQAGRGRFRTDLLYRLNVLTIQIPPLRQRKEEILPLWSHFLETAARRDQRPLPATNMAAQRLLLTHSWPGNVRELQNVAEHVTTINRADQIEPAVLPDYLRMQQDNHQLDLNLTGLTMKEIERAAILTTYAALGTIDSTAKCLGVSDRKVYYRLRDYRREGFSPVRRPRYDRLTDQSRSVPPIGTRVRILLAEDDDELRWGLADFLEAEGYEVVMVPDGDAALSLLGRTLVVAHQERLPDLIVTDLRMPGVTGLQLLAGVQSRGWNIPVVLISAFGDRDTRERAVALGARALLDKPIEPLELQKAIKGALVV